MPLTLMSPRVSWANDEADDETAEQLAHADRLVEALVAERDQLAAANTVLRAALAHAHRPPA